MVGLSLVDHLRLTFGQVIYSHNAHAHTARQCASRDRWLKAAEAILMLATAVSAIALASTRDPVHAYVAAGTAVGAMVTLIARLALDLERTATTHRIFAAQLWHIRERYRALLADLNDGVLSMDAARQGRDALMASLQRLYEHAPPTERDDYERARKALESAESAQATDAEIDRFLPQGLEKSPTRAKG